MDYFFEMSGASASQQLNPHRFQLRRQLLPDASGVLTIQNVGMFCGACGGQMNIAPSVCSGVPKSLSAS